MHYYRSIYILWVFIGNEKELLTQTARTKFILSFTLFISINCARIKNLKVLKFFFCSFNFRLVFFLILFISWIALYGHFIYVSSRTWPEFLIFALNHFFSPESSGANIYWHNPILRRNNVHRTESTTLNDPLCISHVNNQEFT